MKKCILALSFTGSCALIYLYYRIKSNRKRIESCDSKKSESVPDKDKIEDDSALLSHGNTGNSNVGTQQTNAVDLVSDEKDNLIQEVIEKTETLVNDSVDLKQQNSDMNAIRIENFQPALENIPELIETENIQLNNKDELISDSKSPKSKKQKKKAKKTAQKNSDVDQKNVDNMKNSHSKTEMPNKIIPLESSSSPDQAYSSDLERESSHSPEQENVTDTQSSTSLDSGQCSLEVDQETVFSNVPGDKNLDPFVFYQFKVPQVLVGRLIGRKGTFLNRVKSSTSTDIVLVDYVDNDYKLCSIEGEQMNVSKALDKIRDHFPMDQFPEMSMEQLNTPMPSPLHQPKMNREIVQLDLPPGVVLEVQASAVISAGELWLQQPLHPSFSALSNLHQCLNANYGDGSTTPMLPMPIPANTVCVCQIASQWLRCQALSHDENHCTATLLDIGGVVSLPLPLLRQIRADYISLPFQATQCFMYGIEPTSESGWSDKGRGRFAEMVRKDILYATVAAYSQDGLPLINLYQRVTNQYHLINKALVDEGHAKWMTIESPE